MMKQIDWRKLDAELLRQTLTRSYLSTAIGMNHNWVSQASSDGRGVSDEREALMCRVLGLPAGSLRPNTATAAGHRPDADAPPSGEKEPLTQAVENLTYVIDKAAGQILSELMLTRKVLESIASSIKSDRSAVPDAPRAGR